MILLTYPEAMVVGLIQGVTELFPVSSLGHNVLIPALVGGQWARDLNVSKPESPYLAYIVGLHVATALAMIIYFWRDWLRIVSGFFSSIARRRVDTPDQRLAWLIVLATIPVGIAGLLLEHLFRVAFSKPIPTALFLACNGLILLGAERLRRLRGDPAAPPRPVRGLCATGPAPETTPVGGTFPADRITQAGGTVPAAGTTPATGAAAAGVTPRAQRQTEWSGSQLAGDDATAGQAADARLARIPVGRAVLIGSAQILALLPGISRDGIVMATGLLRGLTREDAVRFSFLLSAPVIFAAGALKVPDLMGPLGNGIRGQVLAGSLLSGIGAYVSLRYLVRYFSKSRSLVPFGIYCLVAGIGSALYLTLR